MYFIQNVTEHIGDTSSVWSALTQSRSHQLEDKLFTFAVDLQTFETAALTCTDNPLRTLRLHCTGSLLLLLLLLQTNWAHPPKGTSTTTITTSRLLCSQYSLLLLRQQKTARLNTAVKRAIKEVTCQRLLTIAAHLCGAVEIIIVCQKLTANNNHLLRRSNVFLLVLVINNKWGTTNSDMEIYRSN